MFGRSPAHGEVGLGATPRVSAPRLERETVATAPSPVSLSSSPSPPRDLIDRLTGMGFPEFKAIEACVRNNNDQARAANYLMEHHPDQADSFWASRAPTPSHSRLDATGTPVSSGGGGRWRQSPGQEPETEPEFALSSLQPMPPL